MRAKCLMVYAIAQDHAVVWAQYYYAWKKCHLSPGGGGGVGWGGGALVLFTGGGGGGSTGQILRLNSTVKTYPNSADKPP